MNLLRSSKQRVRTIGRYRVKEFLEDVQHAIDLLSSERDASSQVAVITRASKCQTCNGRFSCADENGNYWSDLNTCPYGVDFSACIIKIADPSYKDYSMGRNLVKAENANDISDICRLAFTLNLYENRKLKGLVTNESWVTDCRSKLLWLLIQYKVALEIQFEDFIEEQDAITI